MEKDKTTYERPTTTLLVIRFGGNLMNVSAHGNTISDATYDEWDDEL